MALTIYGSSKSRTMRVLWMAAELGLDYRHVPYTFDDPALKQLDFLAVNPAGAVPAIDDDGFTLSESLAINLYLAKRYGSGGPTPIYPGSLEGEAQVWRWSLWAQAHLEPWVQRDALLAELRAVIGNHARIMTKPALELLDDWFVERRWLVDDHFTVADLNVAGVLSPSRAAHLDFSSVPYAREWLTRCYDRPAARATRERFQADALSLNSD